MKNLYHVIFTLFCCFFISSVGFGQEETEPNNSFGDANPISTSTLISAKIGVARDLDYYKVNLPEGGIIKLRLVGVPSNLDLDAFIYDADRREIKSNTSPPAGSGYDLFISVCEGGDYFIQIRDGGLGISAGSQFNENEQYSFRVEFTPFSSVDMCECNENFNNACAIPTENLVEASIAPRFEAGTDLDYYKINLQQGGIIKLRLIDVPSNLDLDAFIYDADRREIKSNTSPPAGSGYDLLVSVCEGGDYFIQIRDGGLGISAGSQFNENEQYGFRVEFTPFSSVDMCECNENFNNACAIPTENLVEASIAPRFEAGTDFDYYKINLQEGGIIKLRLIDVPSNLDLDAFIYDADRREIKSNTSPPTGSGYDLSVSVCEGGDYFIQIRDGGLGISAGSQFNEDEQYSFRVEFTPFSSLDPSEENESFADATTVAFCDTLSAIISTTCRTPQADQDYYRLELKAGEKVSVSVTLVPNDLRMCMELFDPNMQSLQTVSGGRGQAISSILSAIEDGFYFIKITECSNGESLEQYDLVIGCSDVSSSKEISSISSIKAFPNPTKNVLNLQIENLQNQSINISLFNLLGEKILHKRFNSTIQINEQIDVSKLSSGAYFLQVQIGEKVMTEKILIQ